LRHLVDASRKSVHRCTVMCVAAQRRALTHSPW
jgi:hypothetical protein